MRKEYNFKNAKRFKDLARPNHWLCSYCGAEASELHHDKETGAWVASFCTDHATPGYHSSYTLEAVAGE